MQTAQDIIKTVDRVVTAGPYTADWSSMKGYPVPSWYVDGKFGIFIHWGLYCVPAFGNEWYPRQMYLQGTSEFKHHVETYGPHTQFGYKDFIPMFKAEQFDPAQWAALFKQAGARFVVPVAEHHDGFAMYDCSISRWTAAQMGPRRDIVGELAAAVRQHDMVFGLSSHRAEHWWFMNGGRQFDSDVNDPQYQDFYGPATPIEGESGHLDSRPYPDAAHLDDWLARTCELVDKYQPQLVWFDWWIGHTAFKSYLQRFAAFYYNRAAEWDKGVSINYKMDAMPPDAAVLDIERGQLNDIAPNFWQTDTSVSKNSWGYISNHDYRTGESLIHDLIDIVSKNGALLLNIGPRPDGTIPETEQALLREIGRWLDVNREAIYGTRAWKVYGEGPTQVVAGQFQETKRAGFTAADVRFTRKDSTLYAILLGWPNNQEAVIYSLGANLQLGLGDIQRISLLGSPETLQWQREAGALRVKLPAHKPCDSAFTLKIETN
ncbi:MAG: alpha-L-fucosidase [Chloroflexi bacterium]|nr:alpha-L-fucosidase [Chloroflexota bacterium]